MNERQKIFCDEYLIDLNAKQAAIRAGYSEKTAHSIGNENLKKPELKKYISDRLQEKEAQLIAKQDEVMQFLTSILRGEKTEQTLMGIGEGAQQITDIDVSAKDRIKAAELLGKRYAMWTDKHDIEGNVGVTIIDDIGSEDE